MADKKISIEIEGSKISLKIDGKKINNLNQMSLYFYDYCEPCSDSLCFDYSVKSKSKDGFSTRTTFYYDPSTASMKEKEEIDIKNGGTGLYARI